MYIYNNFLVHVVNNTLLIIDACDIIINIIYSR